MNPHIFLVAGEESGDRLGAALVAAIKQRSPGARFSGVGGAQMAAAGAPSLFPLGELAIIGFAAVVTNLPKILKRIRQTADAVIAPNRMSWSSSTVPNSPTAWRGACAP